MKLVAGLGNPGRQYEQTRHNIGFQVLTQVAEKLGIETRREAFQAVTAEGRIGTESVLLLWPQTYMNLSGRSVQAARDYYRLSNQDMLIVCDDFALPLGRIRFRPEGSSGGQKGLEDVLRYCGTDVPRLRVGIGPVPEGFDPARYVLGRFNSQEVAIVQRIIALAADGVLDWVENGLEYCMNRYNGLVVSNEPQRLNTPPSPGLNGPRC